MTGTRLPNLLVAGVTKAGSTALFAYLAQHPEICEARGKEVYYRLLHEDRDRVMRTYRRRASSCDRPYLVEMSPTYFFGGRPLADTVRRVTPGTRVVLSLREPAARLWSMYHWKRSKGRLESSMTFEDFVAASERLEARGADVLDDVVMRDFSIGFYDRHLPDWLEVFGDDCRVVFFDDWVAAPARTLAQLCRWLGIDSTIVDDFDYSQRNPTVMHRSRALKKVAYAVNERTAQFTRRHPTLDHLLRRTYFALNSDPVNDRLDPATRRHVEDLYRDANARTASILASAGYTDLPPWLEPSRARDG